MACALWLSILPQLVAAAPTLRFSEAGTLKLIQATDVHLDGSAKDSRTLEVGAGEAHQT